MKKTNSTRQANNQAGMTHKKLISDIMDKKKANGTEIALALAVHGEAIEFERYLIQDGYIFVDIGIGEDVRGYDDGETIELEWSLFHDDTQKKYYSIEVKLEEVFNIGDTVGNTEFSNPERLLDIQQSFKYKILDWDYSESEDDSDLEYCSNCDTQFKVTTETVYCTSCNHTFLNGA